MTAPTKGAYIILFQIKEPLRLEVGRLGTFEVRPGPYAYVGSAMGGLDGRVSRHLHGGRRKHWHIDHLLAEAEDKRALCIPSDRDIECLVARSVGRLPGATVPIPRFGSSDCRCPTHLFLLDQETVAGIGRMLQNAGLAYAER